ncbi:hypothetical protein BKA62DRAFT_3382 [Auriculariales sp. MPI-PUGE-AT-0066]|nr:hypothetical protein BKA62DRAFT_3382 [Auriculariales sp. MPI-PUGE-AT-0066]
MSSRLHSLALSYPWSYRDSHILEQSFQQLPTGGLTRLELSVSPDSLARRIMGLNTTELTLTGMTLNHSTFVDMLLQCGNLQILILKDVIFYGVSHSDRLATAPPSRRSLMHLKLNRMQDLEHALDTVTNIFPRTAYEADLVELSTLSSFDRPAWRLRWEWMNPVPIRTGIDGAKVVVGPTSNEYTIFNSKERRSSDGTSLQIGKSSRPPVLGTLQCITSLDLAAELSNWIPTWIATWRGETLPCLRRLSARYTIYIYPACDGNTVLHSLRGAITTPRLEVFHLVVIVDSDVSSVSGTRLSACAAQCASLLSAFEHPPATTVNVESLMPSMVSAALLHEAIARTSPASMYEIEREREREREFQFFE